LPREIVVLLGNVEVTYPAVADTAAIEPAGAGFEVRGGIHENTTKDGQTILCEWFTTPLMGSDGRVVAWASLALDVNQSVRRNCIRILPTTCWPSPEALRLRES
jgi:hypothetical protein